MDEKKALTRVEFFSALVQLAIAKYVKPGDASSLAEGMHKLLVEWIDPRINYDILCARSARARSVCPLSSQIL